MQTVAVVLAGGTGQRFTSGPGPALAGQAPAGRARPEPALPKQLLALGGVTLLERSVAAFDAAPGVTEVIVIMAAGFTGHAERILRAGRYAKLSTITAGGPARADSTRSALRVLAGRPECNVLLHDAARPLVDQRIIADCIAELGRCEAIGVVVPSADTIAETAGGTLTRLLPRAALARCQTPQGFRLSVIARAHERAAADPDFSAAAATDDCGLVLRYLPQVPVRAVAGSEHNIKITYPGDLAVAEALLRG